MARVYGSVCPVGGGVNAVWQWPPGLSNTLRCAGMMLARGTMSSSGLEAFVVEVAKSIPQPMRGDAVAGMIVWAEWARDLELENRERGFRTLREIIRPMLQFGKPPSEIAQSAIEASDGIFQEHEVWPMLRGFKLDHDERIAFVRKQA